MATLTLDHNDTWRAAVDAAREVLADLRHSMTTLDRQRIAFQIGERVVAKLTAVPARKWTGLIGEPCWVCDRPRGEHANEDCPPIPTSDAELTDDDITAWLREDLAQPLVVALKELRHRRATDRSRSVGSTP